MKAVRNQPAVAHQPGVPASPEHSSSAVSGTYFRAVRPTEEQAAAMARREPLILDAKVEQLRSSIEAGTWRADSLLIAERMLDDGC